VLNLSTNIRHERKHRQLEGKVKAISLCKKFRRLRSFLAKFRKFQQAGCVLTYNIMLTEWLQKLDEGLDLDEEELIYAQIRARAVADPPAFIREVEALPVEKGSSLEDVYEALSYEPEAWHSFYLNEFDRLLALARLSPDPGAVLAPLNAFYLLSLDDEDSPLQQALARKYFDHLDDKIALIRRKCVILLGDFIGRKDFKVLNKLEQMAGSDNDWQVRYYALEAIEEASPERAKRVKLPFLVRLRVRFSNMNYE